MSEQNQPVFDSLECISCEGEALHYAVVDSGSNELTGGLCIDCAPEDEWSAVDGICVLCENPGTYSLEAISPHPEQEDRSTYDMGEGGPFLCDGHFTELSE